MTDLMAAQQRREAVRALINIAVIEGVVLMAVVGVFLFTGNMTHLIIGVVGSALIFGPMFLRWAKNHGRAMQTGPNAERDGDG